MIGWLASFIFLAIYMLVFSVSTNFGFDFRSWLLAIGIVLGNLLPILDAKYGWPYYGGRGQITKSLVFLGALLPVALFVVTSTGSRLGIGLVLGFELAVTTSMWRDRQDTTKFHQIYLFQLARKLSQRDINWVVWWQTGLVLLLLILVFI